MPKFFTLVRRTPGTDIGEFRSGFGQYARRALAGAPAGIGPRRMVLGFSQSSSSRSGWDGVAITCFDDGGQRSRWLDWNATQSDGAALRAILDGQHLTTIEVTERTVSGQERLPWEQSDESQAPSVLLLGLIEKQSALTRKEFADYWWDKHRVLADEILPPNMQPYAYIHNYVVDRDESRWDGIAEMYEQSLEGARERGALIKDDGMAELIADEDRFLVRQTRQMLVFRGEVLTAA